MRRDPVQARAVYPYYHEYLRPKRPGGRGFVVDHGSLRSHIESGHLAGAAVDVFLDEPSGDEEAFVSRLQGLERSQEDK